MSDAIDLKNLKIIQYKTSTEPDFNWRSFHKRVLREFLFREKTLKLWSNPLSIYTLDPVKSAVVSFNAGLKERQTASLKAIEELELVLSELESKETLS